MHGYSHIDAATTALDEKTLRQTQTLQRVGCSKAEPKIFAVPGARDGQNLIS